MYYRGMNEQAITAKTLEPGDIITQGTLPNGTVATVDVDGWTVTATYTDGREHFTSVLAILHVERNEMDETAPALPMPGDSLREYTVVASCWTVDDAEHDAEQYGTDDYYAADVLVLRPNTDDLGYYATMHIVCPRGDTEWTISYWNNFTNIVLAAEDYSDRIGF